MILGHGLVVIVRNGVRGQVVREVEVARLVYDGRRDVGRGDEG